MNRLKALTATGMPEATVKTIATQITKEKKKKFKRTLDLRGLFILVTLEEMLSAEDTVSEKWNSE